MIKAISLFLIGILFIRSSLSVTYITGKCLCQIDEHLNQVRHNLRVNNTYPPTPNPNATTPKPSNSSGSGSGSSNTTSGSGSGSSNTTSGGNSTQKTNSTGSTNQQTYTTYPPTQAASGNSSSGNSSSGNGTTSGKRRKREVTTFPTSCSQSSSESSSEMGVLYPVNESIVSYDRTIRLSTCDGVYYDQQYNATLCNCTPGSSGKLSLCFLNLKYTSDFADSKSSNYTAHMNRLLPWIDRIFRASGIKSQYMRTVPSGFVAFRDDPLLQVQFNVVLNTSVPYPIYTIDSGFQTKELLNGRFKINGFVYETDLENEKGCYTIEDTTPAAAKPKPSLGNMRFVFLGAGCGLALLVLLSICCARYDRFYVRFW